MAPCPQRLRLRTAGGGGCGGGGGGVHGRGIQRDCKFTLRLGFGRCYYSTRALPERSAGFFQNHARDSFVASRLSELEQRVKREIRDATGVEPCPPGSASTSARVHEEEVLQQQHTQVKPSTTEADDATEYEREREDEQGRPTVVCVGTRGAFQALTANTELAVDTFYLDTDTTIVAQLEGASSTNPNCAAVAVDPTFARELESDDGDDNEPTNSRMRAILNLHESSADTPVVVLVGLSGGGLGAGTARHVAASAKRAGRPVVAVVAMPFAFEGPRKKKQAADSAAKFREMCQAVLEIDSDALGKQAPTVADAAKLGDATLVGAALAAIAIQRASSEALELGSIGAVSVSTEPVPLSKQNLVSGFGDPPTAQIVAAAARTAARRAADAALVAGAWQRGAVAVIAAAAAPGVPDYADTLRSCDVAAKGALSALQEEASARASGDVAVGVHATPMMPRLEGEEAGVSVALMVLCADSADSSASSPPSRVQPPEEEVLPPSQPRAEAEEELEEEEEEEAELELEKLELEDEVEPFQDSKLSSAAARARGMLQDERMLDKPMPTTASARARGMLDRDRIERDGRRRREK